MKEKMLREIFRQKEEKERGINVNVVWELKRECACVCVCERGSNGEETKATDYLFNGREMTLLYNTNSNVGLSICFIPLALGLTLVVTFLYCLLFFLFSRANLFPMPPYRSHGDWPTTFDQLLSLSITKVFSFFRYLSSRNIFITCQNICLLILW